MNPEDMTNGLISICTFIPLTAFASGLQDESAKTTTLNDKRPRMVKDKRLLRLLTFDF
jgi:hypothetical protein